MRVLAFSDLHRDVRRARSLVERSRSADVVVGAGDFASVHRGLKRTIAALSAIQTPTILVPGNNETDEALRRRSRLACGDRPSRREHRDRRCRVLRTGRRRAGDPLELEL